MKKSDIVLSAASVASALSALGYLGTQNVQFDATTKETQFFRAAAKAISTSAAQQQIRMAMPAIADVVRLDGELLSEEYARIAQGTGAWRTGRSPLQVDNEIDVNSRGDNINYNGMTCYANCHSACHGSRGWR